MPRKIIHIDLDAFFCAVEELHNPALRGKPFAVGGRPETRGVVASCSYAARRRGVRSAMPMARALRLCPDLVVVPPRHRAYSEASKKVMALLRLVTPLVEQISIDEAFLDVSDLPEPGETIGRRMQAQIRDGLGLSSSVGVAANKLVAKIANEVGKKASTGAKPPFAITVVPPGEETAFLSPLPAGMLWGVGPKTAARLAELGIHTIGGIARWPEDDLIRRFGEHGRDLSRHARGVDERPVVTEREVKSISQEVTFARDVSDDSALERTLRGLAAKVGRRLRKADLAGKTVKLKIRWTDFTTLTRQVTLATPTDQDDEIAAAALSLLAKVRPPGKTVRLIGVGVSGLGPPLRQLSLWEAGSERSRHLQEAIDALHEKYGQGVIQRGVQSTDK
ncbi:MAG: DNA polymerase IV [Chloroflexi bacterium]|nr:DNA polymerase IV [Chloroflexota bacterium]